MFEPKRNHIIVTVLVFMIAIAGYLSLTEPDKALTNPDLAVDASQNASDGLVKHNDFFDHFNEVDLSPDAYNENGEPLSVEELAALEEEMLQSVEAGVVEPTHVTGEVLITKKSTQLAAKDSQPSEPTDDHKKQVNVSFFAEEKMLREQARSAQLEQLTAFVTNETMDKESKAKAAQSLLLIQERIEKENGAESLLRAKGFKDVFVRMDENVVDVVVSNETLSDEQIAQIEEIVGRKTGYTVGQIKISTLQLSKDVASKE